MTARTVSRRRKTRQKNELKANKLISALQKLIEDGRKDPESMIPGLLKLASSTSHRMSKEPTTSLPTTIPNLPIGVQVTVGGTDIATLAKVPVWV